MPKRTPVRAEIFNLTCLFLPPWRGPMGPEHTTHMYTKHMYTKPFGTLSRAKAHAEGSVNNWPIWAKWTESGNRWACDCGPYIFTIKKEKVE